MDTQQVKTWEVGEADPAIGDPISGIVSVYYAVGGAVGEPQIVGSMESNWRFLAKGAFGEEGVEFRETYDNCGIISNVEIGVKMKIMVPESIVEFGERYYPITTTPPTVQNQGTKDIPLKPVEGDVRLSFLLWGRTKSGGVRQLYLPCVFLRGIPPLPAPFPGHRGDLNFRTDEKEDYGLPQWSYASQLGYFELKRGLTYSMIKEVESRSIE